MRTTAEQPAAPATGETHRLKKLRVLVLATTFPRRENDREPRFVHDLTKHLAKKVSLWVLVPGAPGARTYEEMDGVRIIRFPYFFPKCWQRLCYDGGILPKLNSSCLARLQLPFFLLAQFYFLCRTARRLQINFIHCHWLIPQGFFTALFNVWSRVPYILTAHGGDVFSFRNHSLMNRLRNFALKRARLCTVNSVSTRKAVESLGEKVPLKLIPMGVDTTLFHPDRYNPEIRIQLDIEDLFLLGVGRFAEKKGFQYLIQAMPLILKKRPRAKLVLIGFGPCADELGRLVRRLNLTQSVLFPGSRFGVELAEFFATADIFIGPSVVTEEGDTEGQGVVFLEAMASRTAVVASDVGGVSGVVRDCRTGLLVPQRKPESLAGKILLLSENPALRNELTRNGRELVENHYSWEKTAQTFLETYSEVFPLSPAPRERGNPLDRRVP
ncbi:MAG: glycosyltransferase family 4 protein [Nitrospinaceae bacterium]